MQKRNYLFPLLLAFSLLLTFFSGAIADVDNLTEEVPEGSILIWSGSFNDFDTYGYMINNTKWHVCNGLNDTFDLQARFIVGYDPENNDYDEVGETGGAFEVTLTIDQIPRHSHSYFDNFGQSAGSSFSAGLQPYLRLLTGAYYSTGSTGGDKAHENRPPYKVVIYIQLIG